MYTVKVNLTKAQLKALHAAVANHSGLNLRLTKKQMVGEMTLPVTKAQFAKYQQAVGAGKGMELHLSASGVRKIKTGGFLQALLPFLPMIAQVAAPLIQNLLGAVTGKGNDPQNHSADGAGLRNFGEGLVNFGQGAPADLMKFNGEGLRNFVEVGSAMAASRRRARTRGANVYAPKKNASAQPIQTS